MADSTSAHGGGFDQGQRLAEDLITTLNGFVGSHVTPLAVSLAQADADPTQAYKAVALGLRRYADQLDSLTPADLGLDPRR
jgi:hypothetical protein